MEGTSEGRSLVVGDIVQWFGRGRGMVVVNTGSPWEGIENAVLCQLTVDGEARIEGFPANQLEIVGAKLRQSHSEVYMWMTKSAISTVTSLMGDGKKEMAAGAAHLWYETVGSAARDEDRLLLRSIIERARTD